ncbi:MAG TPA: hypothetical protein DCM86_17670 [Verrucomicrobiales bacterium]|nr:hypothetical protein [Verrucomicrobiales bacterium]
MRHARGLTFLLLLTLGIRPFPAQAAPALEVGRIPPPLFNAKSLQQMTVPDDARSARVRLSGVVTLVEPFWNLLFVQDETGGIFCDSARLETVPAHWRKLELEGYMTTGSYLPILVATGYRDLGPGQLPAPLPIDADDLWKGHHDGDRVRVSGFVTEATLSSSSLRHLQLQVSAAGREFTLKVFGSPAAGLTNLVYSRVEADGVFGAEGDGQGHLTSVTVLVQSSGDLRVVADAATSLAAASPAPIRDLLAAKAPSSTDGLRRTRGTVNIASATELWISDASDALLVEIQHGYVASVGDVVEVAGLLRPEGAHAVKLTQARIVSLAPGTPTPPHRIPTEKLFDWRMFGRVVEVEGTFMHRTPNRSLGELLVLQDGDLSFEARIRFPVPGTTPMRLDPGSRLKVSGVLWQQPTGPEGTAGPRILIRVPSDVGVLAPAPWPIQKTLTVVTSLSAALGLGLLGLAAAQRRLRDSNHRLEQAEAELRELNADLEERIRSRTRQLEAANGRLSIEVAERRQAQLALEDQRMRLRSCFELPVIGMAIASVDKAWIEINPRMCEILGYPADDLLTMTWEQLSHPEDLSRENAEFARVLRGEIEGYSLEKRFIRRDGRAVDAVVSTRCVRHGGRGADYFVMLADDITERKASEAAKARLEAQLRQAHKMEAVGTLAGGIAHDFNNILGAVTGFTELARMSVGNNPKAQEDLDLVLQATRRARDLVHQILSFSREQKIAPRPSDVTAMVTETVRLLRATTPASIRIQLEGMADLPTIVVDPSQFQQVVMNLGANAIHALQGTPDPRLLIRAARTEVVGAPDSSHPAELVPGVYVRISVADNGCGIDPKVLPWIFDPFFTTKGAGEGTGLGLSVVHGIVRQAQGAISVESLPGQGASFHVYFPALSLKPAHPVLEPSPAPRPGSGERILFLDDEETLCAVGKRILERMGYAVTLSTSADEAIRLMSEEPASFDLMVTDLTMPGMSGIGVIRKVRSIRPDLPVVLTTGRADPSVEEEARALGQVYLLLKPSDVESLCGAVGRALQQGASAPAGA